MNVASCVMTFHARQQVVETLQRDVFDLHVLQNADGGTGVSVVRKPADVTVK
jgi:hypothetical protein